MSKNIPIRRCVKCTHYNGHICPLEDLETCRFKDRNPDRPADIFLIIVTLTALVSCIMFWFLLAR